MPTTISRSPNCYFFANCSSHNPNNTRVRLRVFLNPPSPLKLPLVNFSLIRRSLALSTLSLSIHGWKIRCFVHGDSSPQKHGEFMEGSPKPETRKFSEVKEDWFLDLKRVVGKLFRAEPWTVPWTAKTIVQVMLLWIASFWLLGSWIIPFLAHIVGLRKVSLTYRGQALYSLLTDVIEGLTGIAILNRCISQFRPLPNDWFKFNLKGKWQFDVVLGCLMFPLVNQLSQLNLNLLPTIPSTPVAVSSVEQSIIARDPLAMAMYAVVVSVCAPIWEEIVFRGFLLPSLTKYMPIWCSIVVSSLAFALAHFNIQRMLPLVFLGVVMGVIFIRTRNLLPSMLLHSLWNAFVFWDLMK